MGPDQTAHPSAAERRPPRRARGVQRLGAAALLTAMVATSLTAGTAALARGELVKDGTFSVANSPNWWNSANTGKALDEGRLRVDVTGTPANVWDAMVGQSGIVFEAGKTYVLSFDASASRAVRLRATAQLEPAPYTTMLASDVNIDTVSRRYQLTFTGQAITQGQVSFQLGGQTTGFSVYLDNVSVVPSPADLTNGFYVNPESNPARWVGNNSTDSRAAQIQSAIASKPIGEWFGDWSGNIGTAVDAYVDKTDAAGKLPILVAYNIPGRDACGGHSDGGADGVATYKTWISAFATAIGSRPAVVIIEPDGLGDFECMDDAAEGRRVEMLQFAATQFRDNAPNTWAYLDAGNVGWNDPAEMADRLARSGVRDVRGFSVNVSNYYTTADSIGYADDVNSTLGGLIGRSAPFVVDTSRNGNGPGSDWCNPPNRLLGTPSQVGGGAELLLWIKVPGDSDGNCGTVDPIDAGQFSPKLAMDLIVP